MKKLFFLTAILLAGILLAEVSTVQASENTLPQPCEVDEYGDAVCAADISEDESGDGAAALELDDTKVPYVLFHLDTCPHCKDEIAFIENTILPRYGDQIDLHVIEVSESENAALYASYASQHGVKAGGVPAAFIGDQLVLGYSTDDVSGARIVEILEAQIRGERSEAVHVPILGRVEAQNVSLPILTTVLGLLDGFNPCAMWVLLFLISLLLGMKDKRRMWWLGSLFILTSGISYFIFMAAWLQLILFIGFVTAVRLIIGLVAIGVGGVSLRDYWKNRKADGVVCKVSGNTGARKTFGKIKDIVHRKSVWWAIAGIIILGFSVNLVELACSAGFPALFTQILAINDIPSWQRYGYMLGYIFFYMLDDMIVFGIAMKTLSIADANGKYAKYANLVSGVLMVLLGALLIFRPEWLMFT